MTDKVELIGKVMSREERIKEIEEGICEDYYSNKALELIKEQQEEINKLKECLNNQLSLNLCLSKQINKGE